MAYEPNKLPVKVELGGVTWAGRVDYDELVSFLAVRGEATSIAFNPDYRWLRWGQGDCPIPQRYVHPFTTSKVGETYRLMPSAGYKGPNLAQVDEPFVVREHARAVEVLHANERVLTTAQARQLREAFTNVPQYRGTRSLYGARGFACDVVVGGSVTGRMAHPDYSCVEVQDRETYMRLIRVAKDPCRGQFALVPVGLHGWTCGVQIHPQDAATAELMGMVLVNGLMKSTEEELKRMSMKCHCSIVGSQYHKGSDAWMAQRDQALREKRGFGPGYVKLLLRREPENPHDKNAVAVYGIRKSAPGPGRDHGYAYDQHLGYIPRADARAVAKVMDAGVNVLAKYIGGKQAELYWPASTREGVEDAYRKAMREGEGL